MRRARSVLSELNPGARAALVVALALALRLVHLTAPPIGVHSWRQTDTASIARNYFEHGYRFAYPEIDWGGDGSARVETEFPAYQFLVALGYGATGGVHEWVARLVSALAGTATVWVLFLLVRRLIDERTALWSALFYAVLPITAFYARTIQPDSLMLLCACTAVYAMAEWAFTLRPGWLLASWAAATMACLLKLPALYLGLPLLAVCLAAQGPKAPTRWSLWLYAAALFGAVFAWYRHAYLVGQESGNSFGIMDPKHEAWSLLWTPEFYNIIIFRRLAERLFTWPGFVVFVVGLCLPRKDKAERVFDWWLVAVLVYFAIVAFNNRVHEYYQLPFMLPGVVYVGKVFARGWDRWKCPLIAALVGVLISSGYRLNEYWRLERTADSAEWAAAQRVRALTRRDEKIIVVDPRLETNPTILYLADRKGWTPGTSTLDRAGLDDLARRGATYLVAARPLFEKKERGGEGPGRAWLGQVTEWFEDVGDDRTVVVRLRPR